MKGVDHENRKENEKNKGRGREEAGGTKTSERRKGGK